NSSGAGARGGAPARAVLGGLRKRVFDVVMASIALALLSPILLATAAFIRLLMGKTIITVQERIGFGGRAFASYIFRTSVEDCADSVALWRVNASLAEDLAGALCATSLDKLPQLINVLRGDMSLIGPRPIAAAEFWHYQQNMPEYFIARPGLTGLWRHPQMLRFRKSMSPMARERYYVRRWSLGLDLAVLFKVISTTG